jgi:hypothetical protein
MAKLEKQFPEREETNPRDAKIHPRTIFTKPFLPFDDTCQSLSDKQGHIENLFEEHTWMLKSIIDNVGTMENPTLMDNVIRRLQKSKTFVNEAKEITEKKTLPYTTSRARKKATKSV